MKYHIAHALLNRLFLKVQTKCNGPGSFAFRPEATCDAIDVWKFAKNWNRVELEFPIEDLRPDIVLLNGTATLAAIEIAVHHEVDEAKAARYEELDIDWVEVTASPDLIAPGRAWMASTPLPIRRSHRALDWRCDACSDERWQNVLNAPDAELVAWRIVDLYYGSGKRFRDRYEIRFVYEGSKVSSILIYRASDPQAPQTAAMEVNGEPLSFAEAIAESELHGMLPGEAIVDSPMNWVHSAHPDPWLDYRKYPCRYRRVGAGNSWQLDPTMANLTWPAQAIAKSQV